MTKTNVKILGASSAANTAIRTPYGPMYPGPAYDRWKRFYDYQEAAKKLHKDLSSLAISGVEVLKRMDALDNPNPSSYGALNEGLALLRRTLETGEGDSGRAISMIARGVEELNFPVSVAAESVPRPPLPDAVAPVQGQRLGAGAYERAMKGSACS